MRMSHLPWGTGDPDRLEPSTRVPVAIGRPRAGSTRCGARDCRRCGFGHPWLMTTLPRTPPLLSDEHLLPGLHVAAFRERLPRVQGNQGQRGGRLHAG